MHTPDNGMPAGRRQSGSATSGGSPTSVAGMRPCLSLLRSHFGGLTSAFALPAIGRLIWNIPQRLLVHHFHPGWPQAGLLLNASWGLDIYWSTLALSCGGFLLYFILAGPSLATTTRILPPSGNRRLTLLRSLQLQLLSATRAWGIFAMGMLTTLLLGVTLLSANPDRWLPLWYAVALLTALVGVPLGIWLTIRYALAVPAAAQEQLSSGDALSRSVELTRGIRIRLLFALAAPLALRAALGGAAERLGMSLAPAHAGFSVAGTLVLLPVAACALDTVCGAIWGALIACFYAQRTTSGRLILTA